MEHRVFATDTKVTAVDACTRPRSLNVETSVVAIKQTVLPIADRLRILSNSIASG